MDKLSSFAFFDPTLKPIKLRDKYSFNENLNFYCKSTAFFKCVDIPMYEEWSSIDTIDLLKKVNKRIIILFAGKNRWKNWKEEIEDLNKKNIKIITIPGASHCFDEEGTEDIAYAHISEYFSV